MREQRFVVERASPWEAYAAFDMRFQGPRLTILTGSDRWSLGGTATATHHHSLTGILEPHDHVPSEGCMCGLPVEKTLEKVIGIFRGNSFEDSWVQPPFGEYRLELLTTAEDKECAVERPLVSRIGISPYGCRKVALSQCHNFRQPGPIALHCCTLSARRVLIEGCGHVPSYSHPEALAEVVRRFLTPGQMG